MATDDQPIPKRTIANPDLISELPDEILTHILSFLPTTDSIKTSFLSKRWQNLWIQVPVFHLDCVHFTDKFRGSCLNDFMLLLDRAFHRYDFRGLRDLRLGFPWDYDEKDPRFHGAVTCKVDVDNWVRVVMASGVKILDIDFNGTEICDVWGAEPYELLPCSETVSSSSQVVSLRLMFCLLSVPCVRRFAFVKTVDLECVTFGRQCTVMDIVSNCPCLESLYMMECMFSEELVIDASNSRLACLVLRLCRIDDQPIVFFRINVPSLLRFKFEGEMGLKFSIKGLVHPIDAELWIITEVFTKTHVIPIFCLLKDLRRAKFLKLSSWVVQVLSIWVRITSILPMRFENLKYLTLQLSILKHELPGTACLLRSAPYLETLSIDFCQESLDIYWDDRYENIFSFDEKKYWEFQTLPMNCLLHHLKRVKINGFCGESMEVEFLKFLLMNSIVLEKLLISTTDRKELELSKLGLSVLLRLPRASSIAKVIFKDETT